MATQFLHTYLNTHFKLVLLAFPAFVTWSAINSMSNIIRWTCFTRSLLTKLQPFYYHKYTEFSISCNYSVINTETSSSLLMFQHTASRRSWVWAHRLLRDRAEAGDRRSLSNHILIVIEFSDKSHRGLCEPTQQHQTCTGVWASLRPADATLSNDIIKEMILLIHLCC